MTEIFVTAGCSSVESQRIAKYLIGANLTGHDNHGVVRVPQYVQMLRDGMIHADREIKLVVDTPVLAVVDGQRGFGQTIAPQVVEIGVSKCRQMGLEAVTPCDESQRFTCSRKA